MQIYPQLIEKYCAKLKSPITISINISENEPYFIFTRGEYWQNGGLEVMLDFYEIAEILDINNVTGKVGAIYGNLDQKETDDIIYGILSKYILQMLSASMAIVIFPEIVPLPKHKDIYFKNTSKHLLNE